MDRSLTRVWIADDRELDLNNVSVKNYEAKDSFIKNFLSICEIASFVPHPCILKSTRKKIDGEENKKPEGFSEIDSMTIRIANHVADLSTISALAFTCTLSKNTVALQFHNVSLSIRGIEVISDCLKKSPINSLSISFNCLPDGGVKFADLVAPVSQLKHLTLRGNDITDDGCITLMKTLEKNICITYLNLFKNSITDIGGSAVIDCLKLNTTLLDLSLADNKLSDRFLIETKDIFRGFKEKNESNFMAKRNAADKRIALQNKKIMEHRKKMKVTDEELNCIPALPTLTKLANGDIDVGAGSTLVQLNIANNFFSTDELANLISILDPKKESIHIKRLRIHQENIDVDKLTTFIEGKTVDGLEILL